MSAGGQTVDNTRGMRLYDLEKKLAAAQAEVKRLNQRVEELESSTQFYRAAAKTRLTAELADESNKIAAATVANTLISPPNS